MYWTLELASYLSDAPWPATRDELIDYAIRTGAPLEVVENLQAIEEEEEETKSDARPLKSTSLSPWLPSSKRVPLICFMRGGKMQERKTFLLLKI